ncbi:hypothetical protein [Streptomyces sp. NPDC087297]|uniref:hypothetical protein n=1 Tax=Streptomyces sp. NPDC087297 TaxID=3365778 RepID=UPI00381E4849
MSPDRRPDLPAPVPESEDPVTPDLPPIGEGAPDLPGSGGPDDADSESPRRAQDAPESADPDDDAAEGSSEPPD